MKDIETSLKTCAIDPSGAMMTYNKIWQRMISVAEKDVTKMLPVLKEISGDIAKIPLKIKIGNVQGADCR